MEINSNKALILYLISFFILLALAHFSEPIRSVYAPAVAALSGAFGGYLVKRANDNYLMTKVKIEEERSERGK